MSQVSHPGGEKTPNCKVLVQELTGVWALGEENWSKVLMLGKALAIAEWRLPVREEGDT